MMQKQNLEFGHVGAKKLTKKFTVNAKKQQQQEKRWRNPIIEVFYNSKQKNGKSVEGWGKKYDALWNIY